MSKYIIYYEYVCSEKSPWKPQFCIVYINKLLFSKGFRMSTHYCSEVGELKLT